MLVNGVSPTNTQTRDWRRSESGSSAATYRSPFRFSTIDVILDLSAEAIRFTGRHEAAPARQQQRPPDTYTKEGTLAYAPPPDRTTPIRLPRDRVSEPARNTAPRRGNTVVIFDGMLRSPPRELMPPPADY